MEDGVFDTLKGSFYANPVKDNIDMEERLQQECPSYCRRVFSAEAPKRLHINMQPVRITDWQSIRSGDSDCGAFRLELIRRLSCELHDAPERA